MENAVYVVRENGYICEDIVDAWEWIDAGFTVAWYLNDKYMGEMKTKA